MNPANKKLILIIIQLLFITTQIYTQNLITLKKDYETYTYYENETLEIIRHGNYSYKKNKNGISYTLKGRYKDGLRHGLWFWYISMKDFGGDNSYNYETSIRTLTINYTNGIPNGNIAYSYSGKKRSKIWSSSGYVWGSYTKPSKRSLSINIINGIISGSFKSTNIIETISGQFDENGLPTGRFNQVDIIGNRSPFSAIYKKGVVIGYTEQPANDTTLILAKEYVNGKLDSISLVKKGYFLQKISPINNIYSHIKEMVYASDLRWYETPGDILYDDGRISDIIKNGRSAYLVTKIKYKKIADIEDFSSALNHINNGNYKYAINSLENVLRYKLIDKEKKLVNKKLEECKSLFQIKEQERIEKERLRKIEEEAKRQERIEKERLEKEALIQQQNILKLYNKSSSDIFDLYYNKIATELSQKQSDYLSNHQVKVAPKMKKKNLYNAYEVLSNYYLIESKNQKSIQGLKILYSKLDKLDKVMRTLINENTKILKKELKKITEPIKIEQILNL